MPCLHDFIIFSSVPVEHLQRLRLVFRHVRNTNFRTTFREHNPDKYDFFWMTVQFLEHIVRKEGLHANAGKVGPGQKFQISRSHDDNELKPSLGLVSYYRSFEPKFADKARPLNKTSETLTNIERTSAAWDAFESLELILISFLVLAFPNHRGPSILYNDASIFAIGALLALVQGGTETAFCYSLHSLSKSQAKHIATRSELPTGSCHFHTLLRTLFICLKVRTSERPQCTSMFKQL